MSARARLVVSRSQLVVALPLPLPIAENARLVLVPSSRRESRSVGDLPWNHAGERYERAGIIRVKSKRHDPIAIRSIADLRFSIKNVQ